MNTVNSSNNAEKFLNSGPKYKRLPSTPSTEVVQARRIVFKLLFVIIVSLIIGAMNLAVASVSMVIYM